MGRLRVLGLLVMVLAVVAGLGGCTSSPSSAEMDAARREAADALARWTTAVASSSSGSSFIISGEKSLMVGGDWGPNIDGGNAKMAWYAGMFVLDVALPGAIPPSAQVAWSDGTSALVPVISAQQALADMQAQVEQPCPTCTPLHVTGAKLIAATFVTSRGPAQAPAWEFSLLDTDVKIDRVAVAAAVTPPPLPASGNYATSGVGPRVDSATVDATGLVLTVTFTGAPGDGGKACGADYTAEAVESDTAVVVIVFEHRNPLPAACAAVGAYRTASVTLAKTLGTRTLIDFAAQPLPVTAGH